MAARDNQGLQIGIMVLCFVVLVMGVGLYMAASTASERGLQIAELEKQLQTAKKSALDTQAEADHFKTVMGFQQEDNRQIIDAEVAKDMAAYQFRDEERFYRPAIKLLLDQVRALTQREVAAKQSAQEANDNLAVVRAETQKSIDTYDENLKQLSQDLQNERRKFNEALKRVEEKRDSLAGELESIRKTESTEQDKSQRQVNTLKGTITGLNRQLATLKKRLDKVEDDGYDVADGRVLAASQRGGVVRINLGSRDAVRRQQVFSVFPVSETNAAQAKKKGSVEVTRVLGPHASEARILTDDVADPILPGDNIYSPIWEPGNREGFGLAGFIDLDGDGESDLQQIRSLIEINGGVIDVEQRDDGTVHGALKVTTRYLILGDAPNVSDAFRNENAEDSNKEFGALEKRALALGVENIPIDRFIRRLGWKPKERTVSIESAERTRRRSRAAEQADQEKPAGESTRNFQRRTPPADRF